MDLGRANWLGNKDAFLHLFDEHHQPLFRFAYRLTGSIADAEDIVQDCFLGLLRADCHYDPRRSPIRTYLFGVVRHHALKRLRAREQIDGATDEPVDRHSPESDVMQSELERSIARAVGRLPENQREVLLLAQYEQMPLAEIAELLEIELGAVKSRLQRARAGLKEMLAAYAPGVERKL
jgi:RNA polymerase sigma-70 factor (ECF subfamily)